jgi:DNA polymerase
MCIVSRPVDVVIEFLEAERARGVTHVLLDDAARATLRDFYRRASRQPASSTPARPGPSAAAASAAPPPVIATGQGTKAQQLAALAAQAEDWAPARSLGSLRPTMVFSTGSPDARVMFVGEAPGHEEERAREPFVGPAGRKLDKILETMGLARTGVYLTHILKFRPATPRQTTNNRPPTPEEIASCMPLIRAEAAIVRPECIVALGATAAAGLLGHPADPATLRGSWHSYEGIPVRVTYHPGCLLRGENDLATKRQLWEDMLAVMEHLGMPVTEKQRGFFLRPSSGTA